MPGSAPRAGARFPKADRLRLRRDFQRVQGGGQRVHSRHYVVVLSPATDPRLRRLGITVTKKVANAVGRNRVKRVLREVFRRHRELFPAGFDVVLVAKRGAPRRSYDQAVEELSRLRGPMRAAARRAHRKAEAPAAGRQGRRPEKDRAASRVGSSETDR